MSGTYKVPFAYTGSANVDLSEMNPHTNKALVILGAFAQQTSDLGDASEEVVLLTFKSGQTSSGSGGSSSTPTANDPSGTPTPGFTAEQANTSRASGGTIINHGDMGWNIRQPFDRIFSEQEQLIMEGARRCTLEISAASDSLTVTGYVLVQEIG